jgi:hypothetical protein
MQSGDAAQADERIVLKKRMSRLPSDAPIDRSGRCS